MKSNIVAALATLLVVTQAAPATTRAPSAVSLKEIRGPMNLCDASTFTGATSGASPLVSDCQQICTNIADGGTWDINGIGTQRQLVQYGSCAFGLEGDGADFYVRSIGNTDIIDLINDAIAQFESDGKVGAEGTMQCAGGGVTWGLY